MNELQNSAELIDKLMAYSKQQTEITESLIKDIESYIDNVQIGEGK